MRGALKERAAASLRPFAWRSEVRCMRSADQSARGKDVQQRGSMAETTCFMQSLHHFKTTFFISMEGVHYYNEHKQLGPIAIQKCPPSINCPRVHICIYTHILGREPPLLLSWLWTPLCICVYLLPRITCMSS